MQGEPFYHDTTKKIIVAFGALFDRIQYNDESGNALRVPLSYSPYEKFLEHIRSRPDYDNTVIQYTLPRLAFEMVSMTYDAERHTNSMHRFFKKDTVNGSKKMWNRVPYTFDFSLYLASKKFDESLRIIEQILPFFSPDMIIAINDMEEMGIATDIPVTLNGTSFQIDYEGAFDNKRTILWTLNFSMKGHLYNRVEDAAIIRNTVVNLSSGDVDQYFLDYTMNIEGDDNG